MQDLNDLVFFAHVVESGGFIKAANMLGMPKSSLSKRVARLEQQIGALLIERSTRQFRVTEIGQDVYQQCKEIVGHVAAAEALVAESQAAPRGLLRISCPPGLCEKGLAALLPGFLKLLPQVSVQVVVTNERVGLIERRVDVAFRVRQKLDTDTSLKMRTLGQSRQILVAAPCLLEQLDKPVSLDRLSALPTISMIEDSLRDSWELAGPEGQHRTIRHYPRLSCSDFNVLRKAATEGIGIALLPTPVCAKEIKSGELVQILPEWHAMQGIIHVVFKATKGISPAVRAFIDYIARELPGALENEGEIELIELESAQVVNG